MVFKDVLYQMSGTYVKLW